MENESSDIDINIDIESVSAKAIGGDKASQDQLMASLWLAGAVEEIATRLARQFNEDRNEIRDRIYDKLRKKITTIKNPQNGPLSNCIRAWCNSTGTRFCLNKHRHHKVEDRYADRVIHENMPTESSPEDILLQKEEDSLWANRRDDLHTQVYVAITKLPPEEINVILLWAEGSTLKDIEQKTGVPLSTVQRHLKKSQKHIVESIGIRKLIAGDAELTKGAYELIANCMLEMRSHGYLPPCAA
nr:hypothetical protein [uncultured bacterium]